MIDKQNPVLYDLVIHHYNSGQDIRDDFDYLCTTREVAMQHVLRFAKEYAGEDERWPKDGTEEEQIKFWFDPDGDGDTDTFEIFEREILTGLELKPETSGYKNWCVELTAVASVSCRIQARQLNKEAAEQTAIEVARLCGCEWKYQGVDDESIEVTSVEEID